MRNHPLYKKLKQLALDGDYTVEQVEKVTMGQIAKLLDTDERFSQTFFQNMKRGLIMTLENRDEELNLRQLKSQAKSWFDANFPNWAVERGDEAGLIILWLKGKPE